MNNIRVTTELCAEDRKRIDELIAFAGLIAGEMKARVTIATPMNESSAAVQTAEVSIGLPVEGAAHLEPVAVEEETPIPVAEETTPEPTPEVKPISLAEFQKAVTIVCAKGPTQKAAAKEIINKYAVSVSAVPEDKRSEVMAELAKL